MRKQRLVVSPLWSLAAGLTCWAAVVAVTTPYNQCDNIAGTCLRDRQIGAITAVQTASVALAALCLATAVTSIRRPMRSRLLIGAVLAVAFSIAILAIDPITSLNNSRTGWLAR